MSIRERKAGTWLTYVFVIIESGYHTPVMKD